MIITLAFLLSYHLFILANLQFTAWPEMLSFPYLYLNGFSLYKDFAHPYTPLLTLILSGIYSIFGLTVTSLQIFSWFWILTTDVLIFITSRFLFGNRLLAYLPLGVFVFLQPILDGNMLWLDLGVMPPFLGGIFFALRYIQKGQKKDAFLLGLFWALTVLIKQQAGLLFIVITLYMLLIRQVKIILPLIYGALIPAGFVFLWLLLNQNLGDFIFWTLVFPIKHLPGIPGYSDLPTIKELVEPGLIFLPGVALALLKRTKETIFLVVICITCIAMAFPRFSYFHLQPALAVYVILLTLSISNLEKKYSYFKILLVLPIVGGLLLARHTFPITWNQDPRFYGDDEINKSKQIKNLIKAEEKIYLLGPYSSLYVFADRLPPKPWYDNFVWYFEIPGMQEKQIAGLERDKPIYILRQLPQLGPWYKSGTYQPQKIVDYIQLNYNLEGEFSPGVEQWKRKN